jgi:hypothetical protein
MSCGNGAPGVLSFPLPGRKRPPVLRWLMEAQRDPTVQNGTPPGPDLTGGGTDRGITQPPYYNEPDGQLHR